MRIRAGVGTAFGRGMWGKGLRAAALVAAGAATLTGCTGAQQQRAGSGTQGAAPMRGGTQTRALEDPVWGVQAATVSTPPGWKFDGVATHGQGCVMTLPDTRWGASSPDGKTKIQYYPQITYSYGPTPQDVQRGTAQGCLVTQSWKPEDFLMQIVAPHLHPGGKPETSMAMTGAMLDQRQAQQKQFDQEAARHGTRRQSQVGFGSVGTMYTEGGTEMAEAFTGFFTCVSTQFSGGAGSIQCQIDQGMLTTAPKSAITNVLQTQPVRVKWTDAFEKRISDELHARNAAQNAQAQQIIAQGTQQQNQLHATLMGNQQRQYDAGVARNKATNDAMHQSMVATANHMGDVNDYRDPATGNTYKASNQYSHTYLDSSGRTILQTNTAYAPGPDTVWQELQPR